MLICALTEIRNTKTEGIFRRVIIARVSVKKSTSLHLTRPTGKTTSFEEEGSGRQHEKYFKAEQQKQHNFTVQLKNVDREARKRCKIFVRGELPENTVVYVDYL